MAVHGSPSLQCLRNALAEADVVLALGTEFGETDYDLLMSGPLELGGELIRIDIDAEQLTRNATPTLGIEADVREEARQLVRRSWLERTRFSASPSSVQQYV